MIILLDAHKAAIQGGIEGWNSAHIPFKAQSLRSWMLVWLFFLERLSEIGF